MEGLTEEQANCLCRCNPFEGDETNGFFVSYFVRAKVDRNEEKYANSVASNSSALKVPMYKAGMFKHLMKGKGEGGKKKKSRESSDQSFDNGGTKRKAEESISEPHKSPKKEQKKTKWTETSETSDISDSKSSVPKPPATKMSKKAAKKNANRKARRDEEKAAGGDSGGGSGGALDSAAAAAPVKEELVAAAVSPKTTLTKKVKAANKKLRQMDDLQAKVDGGMSPSEEQSEKLARRGGLAEELEAREGQLAALGV